MAADMLSERVVLNVGGSRFEVAVQTLQKYPNTLLGEMFLPENAQLRRPDAKGEYFFDRSGRLFEVVLDWYRTGQLLPPKDCSLDKVRAELRFFRIRIKDEEEDAEIDPDTLFRAQSAEKIFEECFQLINGRRTWQIRRGLLFLQELLDKAEENSPNAQQYLHALAFGYCRVGDSFNARRTLETLLKVDPASRQTQVIQTIMKDKSDSLIRNGFLFWAALASIAVLVYRLRSP